MKTLRKNRARRPSLENLETRQLLSTFTVNSAGDDLYGPVAGQVTLRDAITQANHVAGHNDIQFSVTSISLSAPLPAITGDLAIQTSKTQHIQIWYDGDIGPVLTVANSATAEVDNLSITGNGSQGIQNAGNLTLKSDVFIVCATSGNGGAIYNSGTLNVTSSGFYGNSASLGGAIYNAGTLTQSGNVFQNNTGGDVYQVPVLTVHTVSYNVNAQNGLLPQFDPSLGTLTSVGFTDDLFTDIRIVFPSNSPNNSLFDGHYDYAGKYSVADSVALNGNTIDGNTTALNDIVVLNGISTMSIVQSSPVIHVLPCDSFVGTGSLVLNLTHSLNVWPMSPYNIVSSSASTYGTVTFTYTYSTIS